MRELVKPSILGNEQNSEEGNVWRWQRETWPGFLCGRRQPILESCMNFFFCKREE